MQPNEILLKELIQYFDGTASASLIRKIEDKKANDEEFREEMYNWEDFFESQQNRSEALALIRSFHLQWHQIQSPSSHYRNNQIYSISTPIFLLIVLVGSISILSAFFLFLWVIH